MVGFTNATRWRGALADGLALPGQSHSGTVRDGEQRGAGLRAILFTRSRVIVTRMLFIPAKKLGWYAQGRMTSPVGMQDA
jgi:hypothetical protein